MKSTICSSPVSTVCPSHVQRCMAFSSLKAHSHAMQSTWVSLSLQKEIQFTDSQSMKSTGGTINIVNSSNYNTMLLLVVLFQSGETN